MCRKALRVFLIKMAVTSILCMFEIKSITAREPVNFSYILRLLSVSFNELAMHTFVPVFCADNYAKYSVEVIWCFLKMNISIYVQSKNPTIKEVKCSFDESKAV